MLRVSPLRYALTGCVFAAALSFMQQAAAAAYACPEFRKGYGPFNYQTQKHELPIIEGAHFTPEVQALVRGNSASLMGDLDYTIRAVPNHHLALMSLSRYSRRPDFEHDAFWSRGRFPVECYFERALRFAPSDANVHLVYAIHEHRAGRSKEALARYAQALKLAPRHAEAHYNLGLLYVDLKDYKNAREQAEAAYASGYPLPGLRNRLKAVGAW